MGALIHTNQTGFLANRFISENFIAAREIAKHIHDDRTPSVLFKVDFKRAFDSVSWDFLLSVLHHRGFPHLFISWIRVLLSTSSSCVLINGREGPSFTHFNGLRQGDPLSPYLFLLVADVLQKMVNAAAMSIPFPLTSKLSTPYVMLQYADDTLIFATAKGTAIRSLFLTVSIYTLASGLQVNCLKSVFVPFNIDSSVIASIASLFQYQVASLPLNYLGMPLSIIRPQRSCFQVLIEKVDRRLQSWKTRMLSRAGRLLLCKSVLASIPVYFMASFLLPRWVITEIEKRMRIFLWQHRNSSKKSFNLVNWTKVCLPKSSGGLGLLDIRLQNICLLLRWLWRLHTDEPSIWKDVATQLLSNPSLHRGPLLWKKGGSFFWQNLYYLRSFFQLATCWTIGDGSKISFWYDNWGGQPLRFLWSSDSFKVMHRFASVKTALQKNLPGVMRPCTLIEDRILDSLVIIDNEVRQDKICWTYSSDGVYSAASFYRVIISAGKLISPFRSLWSLRLTPSLKLFVYFLVHGKLLTQDVLLKRGIVLSPFCQFCRSPVLETHEHLFLSCPIIYSFLNSICNLGQMFPQASSTTFSSLTLQDFTLFFIKKRRTSLSATIFFTSLYYVWKERNSRIFTSARRPLRSRREELLNEARLIFDNG